MKELVEEEEKEKVHISFEFKGNSEPTFGVQEEVKPVKAKSLSDSYGSSTSRFSKASTKKIKESVIEESLEQAQEEEENYEKVIEDLLA